MTRSYPLTSNAVYWWRTSFSCLMLIALLLLVAQWSLISVHAQSATATLSGTVEDQNGAIIPGVNITVQNKATSLERQTTTNDSGGFTVPLLPPGDYTVTARRDGFSPVEVRNVVLNVGDQKALNIQLKAGDVNATVTVDSTAETVRTDGSVGTVVDRQFVANIPLNGRSLQSLISLTPGVVFTPASTYNGGGQFSVNGQRGNANAFFVDGVSANYGVSTRGSTGSPVGQSGSGSLPGLSALGGTNSLISIDALQEFKIQTSSFAPEFGRTPGGQISLITRSGSNDFHGTVFDYLRNDVLDANDWFANRSGLLKAKERQNDFGGVIGGPIVKNRTFFFFSYEGLRLRQPVTSISTVPTIQSRQLVADSVKPFFNAYPIPNLPLAPNGFGQFVASYSNPATLDAFSVRIDHSLTQKMTLLGTYKHSPSRTQSRSGPLNMIASSAFENDALTLGLTWLGSSSLVNDLRFNWSRARATASFVLDSFGGATVPQDSLLFASPRNRNNAAFIWNIFNGSATSATFQMGAGNDNLERQVNFVDTFSLRKGAHELKFGVDYRRISPVLGKAGNNYTTLSFNISQQPTLRSAGINVGSGENVVLFQNVSAFAQDTWTVSRGLIMTYGLRWDLNPPPRSTNKHDPAVLVNVGSSSPAQLAPFGTKLYKTRYTNFAPRFGVSYQLSQSPGREAVLRGGVGIFYDLGTGILADAFDHTFPFSARKDLCCGSFPFPLDPSQVTPPQPGVDPPSNLYVANPSLRTPFTAQWNAALEQSVGRNQSVTVSYVGSAGRRLLRLPASATTVSGFGSASVLYFLTNNEARSNYRALQLQFQRRLSNGIQGLVSYTWGRSYDTASDDFEPNRFGILSQFLNLDQEYAPSDFDVRHSLSGALTVDLPAVSRPSLIHLVTKDWGLDSLLRFRTALPTNFTSLTIFGSFFGSVRPNVVVGVPQILYGSQYPGGKAINPAAFVAVPFLSGLQGNYPRNGLRFFNASQLDLALRRQFTLKERMKLQFRLEFFNVFNHPNFSDPAGFFPGTNVSQQMLSRGLGGLSPLYQIGGPRSGQVALKLIF